MTGKYLDHVEQGSATYLDFFFLFPSFLLKLCLPHPQTCFGLGLRGLACAGVSFHLRIFFSFLFFFFLPLLLHLLSFLPPFHLIFSPLLFFGGRGRDGAAVIVFPLAFATKRRGIALAKAGVYNYDWMKDGAVPRGRRAIQG
ncbi:hypothetical protein LY76DRAFT_289911 [Colletotrichum caudatum]|nr:hypothetical protein LY76DRAFT_289911 [Colletotrichum caudatum]